jgi:hypothetical protein
VETVSTLRFGTRAKSIENKARVNQSRGVDELEVLLKSTEDRIEQLTTEVLSLKAKLAEAGDCAMAEGESHQTLQLIAQLRATTDKQAFQLEEERADAGTQEPVAAGHHAYS